jgi:hypothetical protein
LRDRHKVPRGSGSHQLSLDLLFRIVVTANLKGHFLTADNIRWLSAMGVSSHWKRPADGGSTRHCADANMAAETPGSHPFRIVTTRRRETDQALALLSTARSERSA